jgi:hypothetical protein
MHRLAKLGFSQSYTYFTWRNTKAELTEYFTELTRGPGRDYFRPNCWPNTPDILPEYLQLGGRPAFISRLVLARRNCRRLHSRRCRPGHLAQGAAQRRIGQAQTHGRKRSRCNQPRARHNNAERIARTVLFTSLTGETSVLEF